MTRRRRDALRAQMSEALDRIGNKEQPALLEALEICGRLRGQLAHAGQESPFLLRQMAVAADYLGRYEEAFAFISEALTLDCLCPQVAHSYEVIVGRIRLALRDGNRRPDDPTTPRLYRLLVARGEASDSCHLAMARHYHYAARYDDAAKILKAVTLMNPASVEAWEQLAAVATALGDLTLAARARGELFALDATPTNGLRDRARA